MFRMIVLWVCCGWLATTYAGEIYKWKDAEGKTHYGDSAHEAKTGAKAVDLRNRALSEEQRQAAEARVAKQKELLKKNAQPAAPPPTQTPDASNTTKAKAKETECEAAWRKYRESDACFAPYRLVGGGIKVEAFQHCTEVPEPKPCQ